jgi:predicted Zn-ribbon and HTH transcriptional regulator
MTPTLTIEEFNALLNSQKEESPLLKALRELAKIEKPEDILMLVRPLSGWTGWGT